MITDEQILAGLVDNDEDCFKALLDRYTRYAAAVAAKVSSGRLQPPDIEEIIADVFIAIWKTSERIDPSGTTLKGYIGAAARNQTISAMRKKVVNLELLDANEDTIGFISSPSTEQVYLEREGVLALESLVDQLREPDREIFIRRYFYLEKVMDIAGRLNMNDKAVSARICRMRQKLQKSCSEGGF